jgi:hypothetical protein
MNAKPKKSHVGRFRPIIHLMLLTGLLMMMGQAIQGCKKDEPPPPMPVDKEEPPATPATVVLTPIEDAGDEDGDGDAKPVGRGTYVGNLAACCAALQGNAASAPPPQNIYYQSAAAYCNGANKSGQSASAVNTIRGMLRGANLPSSCR